MKKFVSKSLKETSDIAREFAVLLAKSKSKNMAVVVGLYGDLGSGKTAFTKEFAKVVGIKGNLISPTFVIQKNYKIPSPTAGRRSTLANFKNLSHIDAYRLKSGDELLKIRWQELIDDPYNLVFIEWPENVAEVMPKDHMRINFKFIDENKREIKIYV